MPWREAGVLDGAGLTILLTRHVLVGSLPFVVRIPAQDFALWANQVVAVIDEIAAGHHAGFLPGMDGNARRDVLFLQQMPESTITVAGVSRQ